MVSSLQCIAPGGCQGQSPGTNAASPQDIHHAIVGSLETIVEAGILNGERRKAGKDGEKLSIVFTEGACFTGIDTHHPNSLAVHLQGYTQDRNNALSPGRFLILETTVLTNIWNNDRSTTQSLAIDRAMFYINRPLG